MHKSLVPVYDVGRALLQRIRPGDIQNALIKQGNELAQSRLPFFRGRGSAGVYVDHDSALTFSAVFACVKILSETIATMSMHPFEKDGKKKIRKTGPLDDLLSRRPNGEMHAFTIKEILTAHCVLRGNGYAEIERNALGEPIAIWPLLPDRTAPFRDSAGELWYAYKVGFQSEPVAIPSADIFHLKGMGYNGSVGYDVISYATQTISTGMAAEQFSGAFFGNGAHLSGALMHPSKLTDEAREHIRHEFEAVYRGSNNAFRMAVFEEGMKWDKFSVDPQAAQTIETREYSIQDVARWFRVPPHMLADLKRATFSNIEHQSIEFVMHTMLPWVLRWEQEADAKLLTQPQRDRGMFIKLNVDSLLRGDLKARYDAYKIGREWGWLSANDIREFEDLDGLDPEIGDVYIVPMNHQPADRLVAEPEAPEPPSIQPEPLAPLVEEAAERVVNRFNSRANTARRQTEDPAELGRKFSKMRTDSGRYMAESFEPIFRSVGAAWKFDIVATIALLSEAYETLLTTTEHAPQPRQLAELALNLIIAEAQAHES